MEPPKKLGDPDFGPAPGSGYTLFEFQPGASLLDKVTMRLLSMLGWAFAKSGKKFVAFGPSVVSLGVSLDLSRIWEGQIQVANKPGRIAKIVEMLRPIIAGEPVTKAQLASLRGLINPAGGTCWVSRAFASFERPFHWQHLGAERGLFLGQGYP